LSAVNNNRIDHHVVVPNNPFQKVAVHSPFFERGVIYPNRARVADVQPDIEQSEHELYADSPSRLYMQPGF